MDYLLVFFFATFFGFCFVVFSDIFAGVPASTSIVPSAIAGLCLSCFLYAAFPNVDPKRDTHEFTENYQVVFTNKSAFVIFDDKSHEFKEYSDVQKLMNLPRGLPIKVRYTYKGDHHSTDIDLHRKEIEQ